jgi:hypothetical protein
MLVCFRPPRAGVREMNTAWIDSISTVSSIKGPAEGGRIHIITLFTSVWIRMKKKPSPQRRLLENSNTMI